MLQGCPLCRRLPMGHIFIIDKLKVPQKSRRHHMSHIQYVTKWHNQNAKYHVQPSKHAKNKGNLKGKIDVPYQHLESQQ